MQRSATSIMRLRLSYRMKNIKLHYLFFVLCYEERVLGAHDNIDVHFLNKNLINQV